MQRAGSADGSGRSSVTPSPPADPAPVADPPGGQAELPGLPERLYQATPTRLATWLDCPRRYRMVYLDRPRPQPRPQRAHTSVGLACHQVLAGFWALDPPERTPTAVQQLLRQAWIPVGFRDPAHAARWQAIALDSLLSYLRTVDRMGQPAGVERTVAFRTGSVAFSGRVDRLDDREEGLVVVDYKTSRTPPHPDDARTSLALALYALAVASIWRRDCVAVELHHVPTGQIVRHEPDQAALTRKLGEAESIVRDLRQADQSHRQQGDRSAAFPARVSALCRWCDMRAHCPEGQRAGPEQPPWAGLPGEDDGR